MNKTNLSDADLRHLYSVGNAEVKGYLEQTMGKDTFSFRIEDIIHSVDDALKYLGWSREEVIPFLTAKNQFQDWLNAMAERAVLTLALNEKGCPAWSNSNQQKHTAWCDMRPESGFGVSFRVTDCDRSDANVPSRLHLLNESHVELMFERWPDIMKRSMIQKPDNFQ